MDCYNCNKKRCLDNCLNCKTKDEQYDYRYNHYLIDGYQVEQSDTSTSPKPTQLDDDTEDRLKEFLCTLFDLSYNELCCLKAIMNGKSLSDWAREMEKMSKSNASFSRFRAFQTRKLLLSKLGDNFKLALTTDGQRKQLKTKQK